jgi:hypothetical protein
MASDRIVIGLDALLAELPSDRAEKVREALAAVGAEELFSGFDTCTCCGEPTPLKLKTVPYCAPCGTSAIEERSRRLKRHPDVKRWPFPVHGQRCNRRTCKQARAAQQAQAAPQAQPADPGELFAIPVTEEK